MAKIKKRKADKEIENQNLLNISTPKNDDVTYSKERRLSYTLTSPIFEQNLLPNIEAETREQKSQRESESSEDNTETIVPATTVNEDQAASEFVASSDESEVTFKSSKDMTNEIDRQMLNSSIYESEVEPEVNNRLKNLIEKQKREYTEAMESLKMKFSNEQEKLLNQIESNLLVVTSTPMTNISMITTDDEDFAEFKTCLGQSNENLIVSQDEKTMTNEIEDSEKRHRAATLINAFVRGYLTRRLMKTIYVQEHVRNITETLQLVLSLDDHRLNGSPVQNILLKAKLFRQLSTDLKNFNDIFFDTAIKEKMKIIASDREIKKKKEIEENLEQLSLSFHNVL